MFEISFHSQHESASWIELQFVVVAETIRLGSGVIVRVGKWDAFPATVGEVAV
jgi:hypothetical protein